MKIALVTGGSGKIGSEIVLYLLKENYEVVATFKDSKEKVKEIGKKAGRLIERLNFFKSDLSNLKGIDKLLSEFTSKYSQLDLLINSAGIFVKNDFEITTEKEYDYVMNVNLKSNYFLAQKFSEIMTMNSIIINFSSVGGLIPWKGRSLYNLSKSGVIALTRSLALELAPKIRVVSIAPGYIEIESDKNEIEKMPISKIPLQRYGKIDNIIKTIDFIIKNNFITGIVIPVDGGRSLI